MIKTVYETSFEKETDEVLRIMAQPRPNRRQAAKVKRQALGLLGVINTACATLTAVAAFNGAWQSAFAGAAILVVLIVTGRVVK